MKASLSVSDCGRSSLIVTYELRRLKNARHHNPIFRLPLETKGEETWFSASIRITRHNNTLVFPFLLTLQSKEKKL
ncbi:MAG: hypothetical protein ABJE79_14175 [Marinomonas sp.]